MKTNRFILRALLGLLVVSVAMAATFPVTPLPDDPKCTDEDRKFMKRANELAEAASIHGNTAYGAVLVKDGKLLMEFENNAKTSGDVTHHAETGLVSAACSKLGREAVAGATLYTSTEPCIMCCGAIRSAGIKKFVYGTTGTQSAKLRGTKVRDNPLQCREVFARVGASEVIILGPLLEAEGLAIHAAAIERAAKQ